MDESADRLLKLFKDELYKALGLTNITNKSFDSTADTDFQGLCEGLEWVVTYIRLLLITLSNP